MTLLAITLRNNYGIQFLLYSKRNKNLIKQYLNTRWYNTISLTFQQKGGIIIGKYNNKNTTCKELNIVAWYCRMLIHLEEYRLDVTNT